MRHPIRALVLALVAGCASEPAVGRSEPIVNGTIEMGYPAVYEIVSEGPGGGFYSCTGTLISPHVVLTARHCVIDTETGASHAASGMTVLVGWNDGRGIDHTYPVSRWEVIPGSTTAFEDGNAYDIALLVLPTAAREAPMPIARERAPGWLVGTDTTVVGFGEIPAGTAGTKYRGVAHVLDVFDGVIYAEPAICQGDSGGPMIASDGLVYGVASFGFGPSLDCGVAYNGHNEIFRWIDWIDSVLLSVGDLCAPEAEVCDGADNDCNGEIDETCAPLGAACTLGTECRSLRCEVVDGASVCTAPCSAATVAADCGAAMHCSRVGCEGRCAPGALGTTAHDAACARDVDCASGLCRDPGDGRRRCLDACVTAHAECLAGEVCVPVDGPSCGACVDHALVRGPFEAGEPCTTNTDCRSGTCLVRGGLGECTTPCRAGSFCDPGFVCLDGGCIIDRDLPPGGACGEDVDCGVASCTETEGPRYCSRSCAADRDCPADFTCDAALRWCVPRRGVDGAPCAASADCLSGVCDGVCTRLCSATTHCGVGYECVRVGDAGLTVCRRPPQPSGGCSADARGGPRSIATLALLAGLLALRRSRRGARLSV